MNKDSTLNFEPLTFNAKDGFLNLKKPANWTSHDCVAQVRRLLNTKKVGHGGTLDPLATGVLPLAVGRATRLLQYLPSNKAYRAVVRFGVTTESDDLEGQIITQQNAAHLQLDQIVATLPRFIGTLQQTPPMYSAVRVQGKRLYELARKGKTADIPVRTVTIDKIEPGPWQPGEHPEITLDITCGSGTYIRSIARDLGATLGTGATLASLVRTQSNGFSLNNSLTLATIEAQMTAETLCLVKPGAALQSLPSISLSAEESRRWCMGQKRVFTHGGHPHQKPLRVMNETEKFLGIGELQTSDDKIILIPKRVYEAID
ncbi:MAG: tRNA pseudouridine(55) synthase TruB [Cyanobacteria bacterium P01_F01_bin.4]